MNDQAKAESAYPTTEAWLADLDHSGCSRRGGVCEDIHCVFCGKSLGGGFVRCRCAGAVALWSGDPRSARDLTEAEAAAIADLTEDGAV